VALRVERHGHEGDRDLLTGREELVHLALRWRAALTDRVGEIDEVVGGLAHRADDDADLVALFLRGDRPPGGLVDPLGVRDARAAKLLYD
jgi:hypothetical protein